MAVEFENRRLLSTRKRILFCGVLLLLLFLFSEVAAFFIYSASRGRWFSWQDMGDRRDSVVNPTTTVELFQQYSVHVLHPYVGFVVNPDFVPSTNVAWPAVSEFGYTDTNSPIRARAPGKCVIAIVGGSLAQEFAFSASELVDELQATNHFADIEVTVLNLAHGGYKQPQQLMTINYLLALGAEFDIVVNIDGFNEVALHGVENGPLGVFPIYPRNWPSICAGMPDQAVQKELRHRDTTIERRRDLANTFSHWPISASVLCNLIWSWRDNVRLLELSIIENKIRVIATPRTDYLETGPQGVESIDGNVNKHLVGIWQRSSLRLHQLCEANDIRYYHFLQPNQYVAGSKVLSDDERTRAFDERQAYRVGVERGYPLLRKEGQRLIDQGVRFKDLTLAFADTGESVYRDTCCHVNLLGNEILAAMVAQTVIDDHLSRSVLLPASDTDGAE